MTIQGERFNIHQDLEDQSPEVHVSTPKNGLLVRDIQERDVSTDSRPPVPPTFKDQSSGFPAHRLRSKRPKHPQKAHEDVSSSTTNGPLQLAAPSAKASTSENVSSTTMTEGTLDPSIDKENKVRLAQMSKEEIEAARQELMSGLSPSLIEKLLKKANIEEDETPWNGQADPLTAPQDLPPSQPSSKPPSKKVTFDQNLPAPPPTTITATSTTTTKTSPPLPPSSFPPPFDPDAPPATLPPDLRPASSFTSTTSHPPPKTHFPLNPNPPPPLDPSSPTFPTALKEHYFPSLPHNPSSLSWMSPPDPSDPTYSPTATTLPASSLRFDFRGRLLPPRLASQIPVTKGLHHHGHAPDSAGYTIPELARLMRSVVPSQRCVAMQTLGRVLYRLGRGDFGVEGEDLCEGLWGCVEGGRVVEGLVEEAEKGGGNRSVWVVATEACWLWRKGGGRRWKGR